LRRKNRSQQTIDGYLMRIRYFADFLEARELSTSAPDITRAHIGDDIEDLLTRPNRRNGEPLSPEYARGQYRSLQQFFKYLAAEDIIDVNSFDKMSPPAVPDQQVPVPTMDAVRALLAECDGTDFNARRDTAIIRLFADTGMRCGELAPLELDSLDFNENTVLVIGKGGRPRTVPLATRPGQRYVDTFGFARNNPPPRTRTRLSGSATSVR
jgi:site-specific recombinase XerD